MLQFVAPVIYIEKDMILKINNESIPLQKLEKIQKIKSKYNRGSK